MAPHRRLVRTLLACILGWCCVPPYRPPRARSLPSSPSGGIEYAPRIGNAYVLDLYLPRHTRGQGRGPTDFLQMDEHMLPGGCDIINRISGGTDCHTIRCHRSPGWWGARSSPVPGGGARQPRHLRQPRRPALPDPCTAPATAWSRTATWTRRPHPSRPAAPGPPAAVGRCEPSPDRRPPGAIPDPGAGRPDHQAA